jgi:hypothetical protein
VIVQLKKSKTVFNGSRKRRIYIVLVNGRRWQAIFVVSAGAISAE